MLLPHPGWTRIVRAAHRETSRTMPRATEMIPDIMREATKPDSWLHLLHPTALYKARHIVSLTLHVSVDDESLSNEEAERRLGFRLPDIQQPPPS